MPPDAAPSSCRCSRSGPYYRHIFSPVALPDRRQILPPLPSRPTAHSWCCAAGDKSMMRHARRISYGRRASRRATQHSQWGFFGTPRGLGLATATTSAAFWPQREQRSPGVNSLRVVDQPTKRARASGSISRHAPQTHHHAHQELPEAVVELLDVSDPSMQSAHPGGTIWRTSR